MDREERRVEGPEIMGLVAGARAAWERADVDAYEQQRAWLRALGWFLDMVLQEDGTLGTVFFSYPAPGHAQLCPEPGGGNDGGDV